jgi:hypothetical protein
MVSVVYMKEIAAATFTSNIFFKEVMKKPRTNKSLFKGVGSKYVKGKLEYSSSPNTCGIKN